MSALENDPSLLFEPDNPKIVPLASETAGQALPVNTQPATGGTAPGSGVGSSGGGGGGGSGTPGSGSGSGSGQGSVGAPQLSPSSTSVAAPSEATQTTVIEFLDSANFGGPDKRVFDPTHDGGSQEFQWGSNNTFKLTDISWLARNQSATSFDDAETIATSLFSSGGSDPFSSLTNSSVHLNLTSSKLNDFVWHGMTIRINWETQWASGFSQSSVFTVASSQDSTDTSKINAFNANITNSAADSSSSQSITYNGQPPGPVTSSVSSAKHGGGGLSTGAKAGIGVACAIIGIALIAGLAWFLLRRRNRRGAGKSYDKQPTTTSAFIMDKEARANVAESPVKLYADDSHEQQTSMIAPIGRRPVPGDDSVSVARTDGAETPPAGVSRDIAHLVEEGMTEDEIRRLEEEERQLDAEIERAARGS